MVMPIEQSIFERAYYESFNRPPKVIKLPESLIKEIKKTGLTPQEWFDQYHCIAKEVQEGRVRIRSKGCAGEFVTMTQILPYPGTERREGRGVFVAISSLEAEALGLLDDPIALKTWMRRVVSLGLRAPSLVFERVEESTKTPE